MNTPVLSLFYKILILAEDRGIIRLEDLRNLGETRQTLGALGRLEGLTYLERDKEDTEPRFMLTDKGDSELAQLLSYLPDSTRKWDEKWRMILFDVPESQRTVRQMFRLKLMDLGARMLQSSVWITPNQAPVDRFYDIVREAGYEKSVHVFESEHKGMTDIDVYDLWDLGALEKEYTTMFKHFTSEVKGLKRTKDPSFGAKCMIVQLALVTKKDPQLPARLMPEPWVGYNAEKWYKTLRSYCE